jgi:hypothetical protein
MRHLNRPATVGSQRVAKERRMMRHHSVLPADGTMAGAEHDEDAMSRDDRTLALLLVTVWAARTGRVLRPAPVSELTPQELVDFWADDQLGQPPYMPVLRRSH